MSHRIFKLVVALLNEFNKKDHPLGMVFILFICFRTTYCNVVGQT